MYNRGEEQQQAIYLTIEFYHIKQHSVQLSNSKAKSVIEQEQKENSMNTLFRPTPFAAASSLIFHFSVALLPNKQYRYRKKTNTQL